MKHFNAFHEHDTEFHYKYTKHINVKEQDEMVVGTIGSVQPFTDNSIILFRFHKDGSAFFPNSETSNNYFLNIGQYTISGSIHVFRVMPYSRELPNMAATCNATTSF